MNNDTLLKSIRYSFFNSFLNIALDFSVLCNWAIFRVYVTVKYLTFEISYVSFPLHVSIDNHSTPTNEQ